MRYDALSQGDLDELESMPVSTSGNAYADFMHAVAFLRAGMEPGPAPRVAPERALDGIKPPPYPQTNSQPGWLQEEW